MIHHVIYGATFFKQGHSSKNLEWVLAGVAALVLGEDDQTNTIATVQSVFMFSRFPFFLWTSFLSCYSFTPVRNVVFLTLENQNSSFPLHFLFRSSLIHRSGMMGKSLCRVHVYNYVDFDSDKTKPASEVKAILKRFSDFSVHIN